MWIDSLYQKWRASDLEVGSENDLATVCLADALIAQADTQDGDFARQLIEHREGHTAVLRSPWSRRNEHCVGAFGSNAGHIDGVIAKDHG